MSNHRQRYNIKFKQEDVGYVKPWRITDFIEKITTLHYKRELIQEIDNKISYGIKPENIIIFDKSFNIHRSYKNINENSLLTKNGSKFIYHLGNFVSLYPNKEIILLSMLFDLFSYTFRILNKLHIKMSKERLYVYFAEAMLSTKSSINLNSFRSDFRTFIDQLSEEQQSEATKKIYGSIEKFQRNYSILNEEIDEFNKYETIFILEGLAMEERYTIKEYKNLYEKFVLRFNKKFNDIHRPIIGIYNEESKSIEIIATNFIRKEGADDSQIDLKSVTHNSPYEIYISAGVTVVSMLYQMYCNIFDEKSLKKVSNEPVEELETFHLDLKFEYETEEIFDEDRWMENLNKISSTIINENIDFCEIGNHTGSGIGTGHVLKIIERKIEDSLRKNFEDNDFISGNIEIERDEKVV
ncbi:hypothetical protein [Paenibacillus xylanexedens]|uniref:hypothetical protein n=1 Tax=Paenibacillus xylanexedens TaxID=528191 RepID=UPI003D08EDD8